MQKQVKSNQLGETVKVNSEVAENEPHIIKSLIRGVCLIKRPKYSDDRGSFQELFRIPDIEKFSQRTKILQAQISVSKVNVLRGIHAEPRDKVITPISGRMAAVIVDLRTKSPTYKKWLRFDFDNTRLDNPYTTLFVPSGCGNSLCIFKEKGDPGDGTLIYYYTYSSVYDPKWSDSGVKYDDPDLGITWPIKNPIVSDRDKSLPSLSEFVKKYR
jgi:dTDP-4-dehydrorhamnose 3,5-epimerase